jgi:hypothetical protein
MGPLAPSEKMGMWLVGWNGVVPISKPPPAVTARRCHRLNSPITHARGQTDRGLPGVSGGDNSMIPPQ